MGRGQDTRSPATTASPKFIADYPDRFVGVAAVNLEKPVAAVRDLDHAVRDLGFKALRVIPWLWNRPPNDKLYYPLYVKCIELDIPFCTQVGHTGPANAVRSRAADTIP